MSKGGCAVFYRISTVAVLAAILTPTPAKAGEPVGDNVVRQAADAFGLRVGTESIGLYDAGNVRGFDPSSAGNVRLEGLFISQMGDLSDRVIDATSIQVGVNTVGLLFPAPSGIADLSLRRVDETGLDATLGLDARLSPYLELDAGVVPAGTNWSVAFGLGVRPDDNGPFGGDSRGWSAGIVPRWQPSERLAVTLFADWSQMHDEEVVPAYYPTGAILPPRVDRDIDQSRPWADWAYETQNQGMILDAGLTSGLSARLGLFRSVQVLPHDAFALLAIDGQQRVGELTYVLLPATRYAALSGEGSLRYALETDSSDHVVSLTTRGLSSRSRKGGEVEAGPYPWSIDAPPALPPPDIAFDGVQERNHVEQYMAGLAYNLAWDGRLDIGLGLQKADYRKSTRLGDGTVARGGSSPWLYNGGVAWRFTGGTVAYASYTRGLEESGSAPIQAVNRNAVLPAVRTTQRELGLRLPLGPLGLTTALFDVRRPYDGVDDDGIYRFLGEVRHRGLEASLSGQPLPGLSLVLGGVLLDPVVAGPQVDQGTIGRRPVGQTRLQWQASLDYAPDFLDGTSVDLTIDHRASTTARGDNRADAPAHTLVDLGARWDLTLADRTLGLRAQVRNLFDTYGWEVESDGEYMPLSGRSWRLSLTTRF